MTHKGLNLFIVTAGLCVNLYGLYGVKIGVPMVGYSGHFQFLTIVGLLVATLSSFARIINLLTGKLQVIYESLTAIATPVEGLISILYWPIMLYDKEMLVPKDTIFDLPLKLDLSLHLFPTIVCWIDFMGFNRGFKRSPIHIFSIYFFTFLYYVWVNVCYEHNGYWPYPLLGLFKNNAQRGVFFIFCGWFCSLLYKTIAKGHELFHAKKEEIKTE
ncbi:FAR-17a/AIG1-like protein-domain-containing protein [Cokeromyces recurvatus]|uniref:FAR-17a/AIG1-like protein-domain-containing protein n=1 Tax=Cokeromyces recurvatus TaxID=90255 RepID=UPI00221F5B4D|nr:FAR-17a/AIG1-like protein-domain-containing protein [Cokeromyces recurvatus]KAI7906292.1 FAR-17a/AIG1-like protein-domain-containing protein [Cokeromyces recurvatus]